MKGKYLTVLFVSLFVIAGCERGSVEEGVTEALPGDGIGENGNVSIETWDRDENGYLSREEFCAGVEQLGLYAAWDADNSGMLEASEVSEEIFSAYDVNGNGYLDPGEWGMLNNDLFETEYAFGEWDEDSDGRISDTEFWDNFSTNEVLSAWDEDRNGLDPNEFCSMAFNVADVNQDGQLDQGEYDEFIRTWY